MWLSEAYGWAHACLAQVHSQALELPPTIQSPNADKQMRACLSRAPARGGALATPTMSPQQTVAFITLTLKSTSAPFFS